MDTTVFQNGLVCFEMPDLRKVAKLDASHPSPNIDGFRYQDLIYKSWASAYTTVNMLREDYYRIENADTVSAGLALILLWRPVVSSVFGAICFDSVVFCACQKRTLRSNCFLYGRTSCL